jgi:intergrase/recombinase
MKDAESPDEQLKKLQRVLKVAISNGNQLFIENIEREIAALEQGQPSPIVAEYLTKEERGEAEP